MNLAMKQTSLTNPKLTKDVTVLKYENGIEMTIWQTNGNTLWKINYKNNCSALFNENSNNYCKNTKLKLRIPNKKTIEIKNYSTKSDLDWSLENYMSEIKIEIDKDFDDAWLKISIKIKDEIHDFIVPKDPIL